jgi:aspartyl aminopeptidase
MIRVGTRYRFFQHGGIFSSRAVSIPGGNLLVAQLCYFVVSSCVQRRHLGRPVSALATPHPQLYTTASIQQSHIELAKEAIGYLNQGTDPFHAVQASIDRLKSNGFQHLLEVSEILDRSTAERSRVDVDDNNAASTIVPGGKYYYTRNRSTLVAFRVGRHFSLEKDSGGCVIIGGHTDSPNLRIKPRSKRSNTAKVIQLGVECYGGGLWHTWFDRDLGISGRVFVTTEQYHDDETTLDHEGSRTISQHLVHINRPICRISNLAIHLQTTAEREAFAVNKEDHLSPILASEIEKALTMGDSQPHNNSTTVKDASDGWTEYQEPTLLKLLASELGLPHTASIVDFELNLFDVHPATLGGANHEFLFSSRLDNLASCFIAVTALNTFAQEMDNDTETNLFDKDVSMIVLYDHEEVGSNSAIGAASPM